MPAVRLRHFWVRTDAPAPPPDPAGVRLYQFSYITPSPAVPGVRLYNFTYNVPGIEKAVRLYSFAVYASGSAGLVIGYKRVAGQWKPIHLYKRIAGNWVNLA